MMMNNELTAIKLGIKRRMHQKLAYTAPSKKRALEIISELAAKQLNLPHR